MTIRCPKCVEGVMAAYPGEFLAIQDDTEYHKLGCLKCDHDEKVAVKGYDYFRKEREEATAVA